MKKTKLFLTEVDHHHPRQLSKQELRAYILLHSLFFDKLLVGDSQFNNNQRMRSLIWGNEPNLSHSENTFSDMSFFLQEGYLSPVIRKDYGTLQNLREEHERRGVEDVPSQEFVEFADEKIINQKEFYDIETVSRTFRVRVLKAFTSPINCGQGKLSKRKLHHVYDYVLSQEKLLYKSLRDWAQQEIRNGYFSDRDYRLIDKIVSGAYRHNVAFSIDTNIDMPINESRDPFLVQMNFGDMNWPIISPNQYEKSAEWHLAPARHLSNSFLSKIPAEAFQYIKGSKNNKIKPLQSYKKIIKHLERFRLGKTVKIEKFVGDLELYLNEVQIILLDHSTTKSRSDYLARKNKETKGAIVKLFVDNLFCVIGLIPYVGDVVGFLHAGFGGLNDLRDIARQEDFLKGYIAGRSLSSKNGFILDSPNSHTF